jgi:hypothetical protein
MERVLGGFGSAQPHLFREKCRSLGLEASDLAADLDPCLEQLGPLLEGVGVGGHASSLVDLF